MSMSGSNGMSRLLKGSRTSRRNWLRVRRWHIATYVVGTVSWLVGIVVMLLGGGTLPRLDDLLDDTTSGVRSRRVDVYPAWLVLRRTTGWPHDWQVDLAKSFAVAWRGPGALVAGFAWLRDGSLVWTPKRSWAQLGARAFQLPLDRIERVEFTRVSRRSAGLVLRLPDSSEVWLWLRTKDSLQLITRIEDIYSKS
jgi:hypothetical protein